MSTADKDYGEKRDFIRMTLDAEALIHLADQSPPLKAVCTDLSATGISLIATQPLTKGTEVRVTIESPNEQFRSLDASARVLRCDARDDQSYQLGLEILSLS
ncbi:PilZ domain-containing protein [Saccharospirillum impatiens]|uniref:PilZ domain-containing protein n=1 Tax=Saccharospirillum impatiens TaxID=169438 RepID=UPI00048D436C|nr:PilZ domain-containing protein [Saccharospirillum impatiens]